MNAVMEIQGTEIQIKECMGKRVVTFKDIDTVHKRPDGTASRNFRQNRKRFIECVDYFTVEITGNEIRRQFGISQNAGRTVTLITESGYLMLVKSFTDDLAWKVQRELVDTYFRVRNPVSTVTVTETPSDIYMEASKIVAGCIEGNRPYVLNILRHLIPDIGYEGDTQIIKPSKKVTEVKAEIQELPNKKQKRCITQIVDIDIPKLLLEMGNQGISVDVLAKKANVSSATISNWIAGEHRPVLQNRINVCVALGKDKNFLTPKRKRKVRTNETCDGSLH